nr:hypothetical protein [Candidatus Parabeggiatoa sp.]
MIFASISTEAQINRYTSDVQIIDIGCPFEKSEKRLEYILPQSAPLVQDRSYSSRIWV